MLLDLDSTLFETYGKQEGEGFHFHYRVHGYHLLLCYDGLTGDLLKAKLREGLNLNDCEYLLNTPDGCHFEYRNYYDSYWTPLVEALSMNHRPHDTRHTCISMLAAAGVDERVIKKIVGHKGQGVTETVYTHFELAELKDAINKI